MFYIAPNKTRPVIIVSIESYWELLNSRCTCSGIFTSFSLLFTTRIEESCATQVVGRWSSAKKTKTGGCKYISERQQIDFDQFQEEIHRKVFNRERVTLCHYECIQLYKKAYIYGNMGHITCISLPFFLNLRQTWPQGGPDPIHFGGQEHAAEDLATSMVIKKLDRSAIHIL